MINKKQIVEVSTNDNCVEGEELEHPSIEMLFSTPHLKFPLEIT